MVKRFSKAARRAVRAENKVAKSEAKLDRVTGNLQASMGAYDDQAV